LPTLDSDVRKLLSNCKLSLEVYPCYGKHNINNVKDRK